MNESKKPETENISRIALDEKPMLPCPFCGTIPNQNDNGIFETNNEGKWGFVVCCIQGPEVRTGFKPLAHWRQDAIDAWNKRV